MNDVTSSVLLDIKLENQDINQTVMKSIIDEISAGNVKAEVSDPVALSQGSYEEIGGSVLLRVERMDVVPENGTVTASAIQEKNLNKTLMRKDGKDKEDSVVVVPANLKEMQLVRDESGMFKCICCWKVNFGEMFTRESKGKFLGIVLTLK